MSTDSPRIAIVDYQISNLFSVQRACERSGLDGRVTHSVDDIAKADGVILPGVGAFADAMRNLAELGLISALRDVVECGKPFMGICLGLQLLFDESNEFEHCAGLGIIKGSVERLPDRTNSRSVKVPQIAWNRIHAARNHPILNGVPNRAFMYFVHSYFVTPANDEDILTRTEYEGFEYCSGVAIDNLAAFQFHPEKSGETGLVIYENFRRMVVKEK